MFKNAKGYLAPLTKEAETSLWVYLKEWFCTTDAKRIGVMYIIFAIVMGFVGMILVYQAGLQTLRVVPDLSRLGATFIELLVKDLGPSICALMLATRVGAGIAAEADQSQSNRRLGIGNRAGPGLAVPPEHMKQEPAEDDDGDDGAHAV